MEYFNHKNSFFTSNLSQPVGNGAEVWYFSFDPSSNLSGKESTNLFAPESVFPFTIYLTLGKLFLNCDTSICPMYMRGNLVNLAASILGKSRPEDLSTLNDAERRMLSRNLKGLQIHVVHRGESGSKKRFKVFLSFRYLTVDCWLEH
jgi:hypothetical protein